MFLCSWMYQTKYMCSLSIQEYLILRTVVFETWAKYHNTLCDIQSNNTLFYCIKYVR